MLHFKADESSISVFHTNKFWAECGCKNPLEFPGGFNEKQWLATTHSFWWCWESCGGGGCINVRIVNVLFRSHITGKCLTLYLKVSMKIVCDINCSTC